jgi:hypothetical protein
MRSTIEMAQATLMRDKIGFWAASVEQLQEFADLVRADEREACANLLDSTDLSAMSADPRLQNWTAALLFQYAAAIRARGETK